MTNPAPFDWKHRSVLVTGASGLLGGWLVGDLLGRRADVVCLVRDRVPRSRLLSEGLQDSATLCFGDVRDLATVERVLGEYEIRTVFHLAAQTIVPIANRNPISTFESNIRGTWSLLEACRRSPLVSEIVVASSDKAYGEQEALPYTEDMPLRGRNPYDVSKSCADLTAQMYASTWNLPVCITRCGNLFGAGDLNFNRLVPGVIRDLFHSRRPVIRSDGSLMRDYIYVEDATTAYVCLAEALGMSDTLRGRAFNFSLESPMSVRDMVRRIAKAFGSDLEPVFLNEADGEIKAQYLDASRAREELGWQPIVGIDEGLARTVMWYRQVVLA